MPTQLGSVCLGTLGFKLNSVLYEWSHVTPGNPRPTGPPGHSCPHLHRGHPSGPEKCADVRSAGPQGAPRRQGCPDTEAADTLETHRNGNCPRKQRRGLRLPCPAECGFGTATRLAHGWPVSGSSQDHGIILRKYSCHLNATQVPRHGTACQPLPQAQHVPRPRGNPRGRKHRGSTIPMLAGGTAGVGARDSNSGEALPHPAEAGPVRGAGKPCVCRGGVWGPASSQQP